MFLLESHIEKQELEIIKEKTTTKTKILIITSIIFVLTILLLIFQVLNLTNRVVNLTNEIKHLKNPIIETVTSVEEDPEEDPIVIINRRLDAMLNGQRILEFEFDMSNAGIVTDNFYTAKLTAYDLPVFEDLGGLSMYVNLDNQPSMSSKYKGQGNFDVPDRELKSMLLEVIEKLKKEWEDVNKFRYLSPEDKEKENKFEDGTYYISVKGFDVATMEKGTLKLKGE